MNGKNSESTSVIPVLYCYKIFIKQGSVQEGNKEENTAKLKTTIIAIEHRVKQGVTYIFLRY